MKLDIVIADPAGNITAFVKNEQIPAEKYSCAAQDIMARKEFGIEQVGFIKKPLCGGDARLEMMGGEFCGNAARSFGLYLAGQWKRQRILVEMSGCGNPLEILADPEKQTASSEMPLPEKQSFLIMGEKKFPVITIPGITHVIVPDTEPSQELTEQILQTFRAGEKIPDAVGVLYLRSKDRMMIPVVWVRETGSCVWEHSCGSGSVAAGAYLARNLVTGKTETEFHMPGGNIRAFFEKAGGRFLKAGIGGPVRILGETSVESRISAEETRG